MTPRTQNDPKPTSKPPFATEAIITLIKNRNISYSKIMALGASTKYKRSAMHIKEDDASIAIHINANDVTALRASVNAVLRDLQVIASTDKEFRKSPKSKGI